MFQKSWGFAASALWVVHSLFPLIPISHQFLIRLKNSCSSIIMFRKFVSRPTFFDVLRKLVAFFRGWERSGFDVHIQSEHIFLGIWKESSHLPV